VTALLLALMGPEAKQIQPNNLREFQEEPKVQETLKKTQTPTGQGRRL
jgi:hypothetical protein